MRPILALAMLLLAMSSAAPEPEYSQLIRGLLPTDQQGSSRPLVEIESAIGRSDRLPMLIPASPEVTDDPALASLGPAAPMPLPPQTKLDPDASAPAAPNPDANNPPAPARHNNPPPAQ